MSNASGWVTRGDETIAWFEYSGTVDVAVPQLYLTSEAMEADWRKPNRWVECKCGLRPEAVTLHTCYGSSPEWSGTVCLTCMCIVDGLSPYPDLG